MQSVVTGQPPITLERKALRRKTDKKQKIMHTIISETNRTPQTYMMMNEVLCEQPRGRFYAKFWAVNELSGTAVARDGIRHSVCRMLVVSSCLALLASPDSAGRGLGRARFVSRRGVLFSSFFQNHCSDLNCPFVGIDCLIFVSLPQLAPLAPLWPRRACPNRIEIVNRKSKWK